MPKFHASPVSILLFISCSLSFPHIATAATNLSLQAICTINDQYDGTCVEGFTENAVTFFLTGYDASAIQSFEWNFGDGTTLQTYPESNFTEVMHSYQQAGDFTVTVSALGAADASTIGETSYSFRISDVITGSVSAETSVAGLTVRVSTNIQDGNPGWQHSYTRYSNDASCTFLIDYGDGMSSAEFFYISSSAAGPMFEHTYQSQGYYTVSLSASCNGDGPGEAPSLFITEEIHTGQATGTTIDFEALKPGSYLNVISQEMLFEPLQAENLIVRDGDTQALQPRWGDVLRISQNNGVFDLTSFDYRSQWLSVGGTATITGYQADGSLLTTNISHNGSTDYTTKFLNWTNLNSVDIDFETAVQLDNFVVDYSQTPATTSIDFETSSAGSYKEIISQNMRFEPVKATDILIRDDHTQALQPRWGDLLRITQRDGTVFDLNSFDYRSQWLSTGGTAQITGYSSDGSILTDSFTHDGSGDSTIKILNWKNLKRVEIDFETAVQLDNFVLGGV